MDDNKLPLSEREDDGGEIDHIECSDHESATNQEAESTDKNEMQRCIQEKSREMVYYLYKNK